MTTSKSKIEQCVQDVISKYRILQCPADSLTRILDEEKIKYRELELDTNLCGLIAKTPKGNTKIIINKGIDHTGRKKFTIAHELGHYFLDHPYLEKGYNCNVEDVCNNPSDEEKNINEVEANYFAANLLMPRQMVYRAFIEVMQLTNRDVKRPLYVDNQKCNYVDWLTCCSIFNRDFKTSKEAIRYRLEGLGLMKFNMQPFPHDYQTHEKLKNYGTVEVCLRDYL